MLTRKVSICVSGMRCLHIHANGEQCPANAIEGFEFCADHLAIDSFDEPMRLPLVFRLARRGFAVLLLSLFLFQFYLYLRMLYSGE